MIMYTPVEINTNYNSIPDDPISAFDKNKEYVKDTEVIYENKIYNSLQDITKTVNHIWYNGDENNEYGFDLYTNANIPDPTSVPVVNGETLVYVISNRHFYEAKVTGNIDYTSEDINNPANFNDLGEDPDPLYRNFLNFPDGKRDTLYWEYKGYTNKTKAFDDTINSQSINDRQFIASNATFINATKLVSFTPFLPNDFFIGDKVKIDGTVDNDGIFKIATIAGDRLSFTVEEDIINETIAVPFTINAQAYFKWTTIGIDRISLFNVVCEKVELKVTVGGTTEVIEFEMRDTDYLNYFEIFCFNEPKQLNNKEFEIIKNYNQEIEITFIGATQKIGNIFQGSSNNMYRLLDNSNTNPRIGEGLTEATNGDVYLDEEKIRKSLKDSKNFEIMYPSSSNSVIKDNFKNFIGKAVIMSGSIGDEKDKDFINSYCYIKNHKINHKVQDEQSTATFEIREF